MPGVLTKTDMKHMLPALEGCQNLKRVELCLAFSGSSRLKNLKNKHNSMYSCDPVLRVIRHQ